MGYSDAYRAFEQTLQQARTLSNAIAGRVADDAAVDGSFLFARMGVQAYSLMQILPPIKRYVECVDLCSCASITRNLIETFLMMNYLWLEDVSPNVKRFRLLLWQYHRAVEALKGINCHRIAHGKEPYGETDEIKQRKEALRHDPAFLELPEKRRNRLLEKPEPYAPRQQDIAVAAGVAAEIFDADYKFLSSLSHPNGAGVEIMGATTLSNNDWQIWFAQVVWNAQTYLELGVLRVSEQYRERS